MHHQIADLIIGKSDVVYYFYVFCMNNYEKQKEYRICIPWISSIFIKHIRCKYLAIKPFNIYTFYRIFFTFLDKKDARTLINLLDEKCWFPRKIMMMMMSGVWIEYFTEISRKKKN